MNNPDWDKMTLNCCSLLIYIINNNEMMMMMMIKILSCLFFIKLVCSYNFFSNSLISNLDIIWMNEWMDVNKEKIIEIDRWCFSLEQLVCVLCLILLPASLFFFFFFFHNVICEKKVFFPLSLSLVLWFRFYTYPCVCVCPVPI